MAVPNLSLRRAVSAMSRRVSAAPLAVTTSGELLVNVAELGSDVSLDAVLDAARNAGATVFVGIVLSRAEARFALARLDNAADETAARISGERHRQERRSRGVPVRRAT